MNVILGLGSNLGEKNSNLIKAIELLKSTKMLNNIVCSAIYKTRAILPPDTPSSWDKTYLNMVIGGDADLPPYEMLAKIKKIEASLGRNLSAKRWSPRVIDIDILAYKDYILDEESLTIPHKLLFTRKWAVIPFAEIAPDWEFINNPLGYKAKLEQIITELEFDDSLFMKIGEVEYLNEL